jgi:hypothetical protein
MGSDDPGYKLEEIKGDSRCRWCPEKVAEVRL